jgi:hypothetical protein
MSAPSRGRPKFLVQITDGNEVRWQVFELTRDDLAKCSSIPSFAITFPEQATIVLDGEVASDVRDVAFFHELCHVVFSAPGDPETLSDVFRCRSDKVAAAEERLVSFMAPRLYALLVKNGLLTMPRMPATSKATRRPKRAPKR